MTLTDYIVKYGTYLDSQVAKNNSCSADFNPSEGMVGDALKRAMKAGDAKAVGTLAKKLTTYSPEENLDYRLKIIQMAIPKSQDKIKTYLEKVENKLKEQATDFLINLSDYNLTAIVRN